MDRARGMAVQGVLRRVQSKLLSRMERLSLTRKPRP